jgi:uncharacterized protein (DUF1697 family)
VAALAGGWKTRKEAGSMRYAALLRAVNLVKHNRIAMADLRRILSGLGYADVATHLASGNAVFTSDLAAGMLEVQIIAALAEHAALSCAVMVRSGPELAAIVAANPLRAEPDNPSHYFVSFLAAEPDPAMAAQFMALDLSPERAWVIGREAYFETPPGVVSSLMTAAFLQKQLGIAGTARNWNTVNRLAELTYSPSS